MAQSFFQPYATAFQNLGNFFQAPRPASQSIYGQNQGGVVTDYNSLYPSTYAQNSKGVTTDVTPNYSYGASAPISTAPKTGAAGPKPPAPPSGGNNNKGNTTTGGTGGTGTGLTEAQKYINQMYQPTLDLLSNQLNALPGQFGQNATNIQSMYDPQYQQLDAARQSGISQNQAYQDQTHQQAQSAIDQASKIFQELGQRNQQLYGGSSSAGQFGSEINGRELQGNVASATQTEGNNINSLQRQLSDINSQYTYQKLAIDQQKNQALLQNQQELEKAQQAIQSQQASVTGTKAGDMYQALQQFNANKQNILMQGDKAVQDVYAQAQQAALQTQSAIAQYTAQAGGKPDLSGFSNPQFSQYQPQVNPQTGEVQNAVYSPYLKKYYGLS